MYRISDQQIDFILNDISARGVEMESLQQNLLDHICCIIENDLEENGDFESFYQKTVKTFYKDALWEIEEETLLLLTFKNYYTMKKVMITSGVFSAAVMSLGILFKFMHWPGASIGLLLGIVGASFVFLPLLFTLKAKEKQSSKDKLTLGLATLLGILIGMSVLFKILHWPGANMMGIIFAFAMLFVYIPVYFFSGIKNPDTKVNTIVTTILLIMGCGLFLTLVNARPSLSVERKSIKVDQYMEDSYRKASTQNQLAYERLASDSTTDKARIEKLKITCKNLCDDIEALKLSIVRFTEEDETIAAIDYAYLYNATNYDGPTWVMFDIESGEARPPVIKLKRELAAFNSFMATEYKRNSSDLIDLSDKKDDETQGTLSWEKTNFYQTPMLCVLRNLTLIQTNIRFIESGYIH